MKLIVTNHSNSALDLRIIPVIEDFFQEIMKEKLPDLTLSTAIFSGKQDSTYLFQQEDALILLVGLGKSPEI